MSFLSSLADVAGIVGAPFTGGASLALTGAGLAMQGQEDTNSANQAIASGQENFQAQQYASRYQTTVKDMEAAGLNPMLAYSQGPGSSPSGAAIPMQNPAASFGSALTGASQMMLTSAQAANTQADTLTKLANLPEHKLGGDIFGALEPAVKSIVDRLTSSASSVKDGSISVKDLPPLGRVSSASGADDWLSQLVDAAKAAGKTIYPPDSRTGESVFDRIQ